MIISDTYYDFLYANKYSSFLDAFFSHDDYIRQDIKDLADKETCDTQAENLYQGDYDLYHPACMVYFMTGFDAEEVENYKSGIADILDTSCSPYGSNKMEQYVDYLMGLTRNNCIHDYFGYDEFCDETAEYVRHLTIHDICMNFFDHYTRMDSDMQQDLEPQFFQVLVTHMRILTKKCRGNAVTDDYAHKLAVLIDNHRYKDLCINIEYLTADSVLDDINNDINDLLY